MIEFTFTLLCRTSSEGSLKNTFLISLRYTMF